MRAATLVVAIGIGLMSLGHQAGAAEPASPPTPAVLAWATFDAGDRSLGFKIDKPEQGKRRQVVAESGSEFLLAVQPGAKPDPAAVAVAEAALAKLLKVPAVQWDKHRVVFSFSGPSRASGDHRLDLWRTGPEAVAAQWTLKESGEYKFWQPAAAALVERTKDRVQLGRLRYIDVGLNLHLLD